MKNKLLVGILILSQLLITSIHATEKVNVKKTSNRIQLVPPPPPNDPQEIENKLQALVSSLNLTPATGEGLGIPSVSDPKVVLGKALFFTKNLGGEQSSACVSCHHPVLGGGDELSLSVGVDAVDEFDVSRHALLGIGRFNDNQALNLPIVSRNAPTIFNVGLLDRGLFWDSRVEFADDGGIFTPDSAIDEAGQRIADPHAGNTLAAAQARFPVTSPEEMRGQFAATDDNQSLRAQLSVRFDNSLADFSSSWPMAFANAYGDEAVSFDRIADAIGEYERSMLFINNPWKAYLEGDSNALTSKQKEGALLFFTSETEGGAGCSGCHSGGAFTSNIHFLVAFPQMGIGQGNPSHTPTSHDFGRENVTGVEADRFHFRAPTLLNVAETAPYGHSGTYKTLEEVVGHYSSPRTAIERLFGTEENEPFVKDDAPFCELPQIKELMIKNNQSCEALYPDAYANSVAVVDHLDNAIAGTVEASAALFPGIDLNRDEVDKVVVFLQALTDPCIRNRACLDPWIVDENDVADFPDPEPLIAEDKRGRQL